MLFHDRQSYGPERPDPRKTERGILDERRRQRQSSQVKPTWSQELCPSMKMTDSLRTSNA